VTIADLVVPDSNGGSLQWKPAISNVVHPTHRGHTESLSWHIGVRRRQTVRKSVVSLLRKLKDVLGMAYSQFMGYSAEVQDSLDDSSDTVEKLFRLPV
jgi:hypothetical protein